MEANKDQKKNFHNIMRIMADLHDFTDIHSIFPSIQPRKDAEIVEYNLFKLNSPSEQSNVEYVKWEWFDGRSILKLLFFFC